MAEPLEKLVIVRNKWVPYNGRYMIRPQPELMKPWLNVLDYIKKHPEIKFTMFFKGMKSYTGSDILAIHAYINKRLKLKLLEFDWDLFCLSDYFQDVVFQFDKEHQYSYALQRYLDQTDKKYKFYYRNIPGKH